MKKIALICLILFCLVFLTSCGTRYVGTYRGTSEFGIPVEIELSKNGSAATNIVGFPVYGSYKVSGNKLSLVVNSFGMNETITGKITGNGIEFADIKLKKID